VKRKSAPKRNQSKLLVIVLLFAAGITGIYFFIIPLLLSSQDKLLKQAYLFEKGTQYEQAYNSFKNVWKEYLSLGNINKAWEARRGQLRSERIAAEYPISGQDLQKLLKDEFPTVPEPQKDNWLNSLEKLQIDNSPYYYFDVVKNIRFRNPKLMVDDYVKNAQDPYDPFKTMIIKSLPGLLPYMEDNFVSKAGFEMNQNLSIPRVDLPKSGVLKVWIPLPIIKEDQPEVKITVLEPKKYLVQKPNLYADLGQAYFEIPLTDLQEDVEIQVQADFSHFEQNVKVDPENVGKYDTAGDLYKTYTRSSPSITITDDIKKTAQAIVGNEKNPYLQAKKVYEYFMKNIFYSYVPHISLGARQYPESIYVYENKYGDCGAQSMLYSAMLRSLGVPARTTGGYQMFPLGAGYGGHFWAEFYLPNYGWVPVDVTAADMADYIVNATDEEKTIIKNYFFGNMDYFRMNIQKDVDLKLSPEPNEPPIIPMAIQQPSVECLTCGNDLSLELASKYWKINIKQTN